MNLPNTSKIKSFKAFTLIELLIVIGIIGILAGVVLVIINPVKQQEKAHNAVILASMDKLTMSLESNYSTMFSYPTDVAALIADTSSRLSPIGSSSTLFAIDGVNLPAICATDSFTYSPTLKNQCYFYYYPNLDANEGCIYVVKNKVFGSQYYVAKYGRVVESDNPATTCGTIVR